MRFLSRDAIPVFIRAPGFDSRPSPPLMSFDVFYVDPLVVGLHVTGEETPHCHEEDTP